MVRGIVLYRWSSAQMAHKRKLQQQRHTCIVHGANKSSLPRRKAMRFACLLWVLELCLLVQNLGTSACHSCAGYTTVGNKNSTGLLLPEIAAIVAVLPGFAVVVRDATGRVKKVWVQFKLHAHSR